MNKGTTILSGALVCALAAASAAPADVVYETEDPYGGFLGIIGFDVYPNQSVAVRFSTETEHTLDRITIWLWNNGNTDVPMTLTLRTDDVSSGDSIPSDEVIESWALTVPDTGGFIPTTFDFDSVDHPTLEAGVRYWIVAESDAPPGFDPVWALSFPTLGTYSLTDFFTDEWSPAAEGPVPAAIVEATPTGSTPADINGDGAVNASDLALLLGGWGDCPACCKCQTDLNGDGVTNAADLALLLGNWTG